MKVIFHFFGGEWEKGRLVKNEKYELIYFEKVIDF